MGYVFNVGPEVEFYYFKDAEGTELLDRGGYFDLTSLDYASDLRRDTVLTLTPHCRAISLMVICRASSPSWAIPQRGNITGNVPDRLRYYFTNFRVLCQWHL